MKGKQKQLNKHGVCHEVFSTWVGQFFQPTAG